MEENNTYKWYTLNVFSNQELKIKDAIVERIKLLNAEDLVEDLFVPTEQVKKHYSSGKTTTRTKCTFSGYIFIKMKMTEKAFNVVRGTPKVTGFVGGVKPVVIPEKEVLAMRTNMQAYISKPKVVKTALKVGDGVKIISGAFQNFAAQIKEIESDKLKVSVNIFGRETLLDIGFNEVEQENVK
jgi:transcriptional antiterminator NusG